MTAPLHIMVDMDGTLCDWNSHYEALLTEHFPHLTFNHGEDNRNWDLTHGLDEEGIAAVKFVMDMPGFYADLKPYPGATQALRDMIAEGHHVTICSSPWLTNPTCLQDKVNWLNKYVGEGWGDRAIFTKDKTAVCGDVLIDDKPEITGVEAEPSWRHILYDQPYNRHVSKPRMFDWANWRQAVLSKASVLGFGGVLRSGKDTAADRLVEQHGWVKLNMSDPLAEALYTLNPRVEVDNYISPPLTRNVLFSPGTYHYQDIVDKIGYVEAKTIPDVRRLLQALGTEVGREMIDQNVWVNIAARRIQELTAQGKNVAITGIRFPNEIEMIREVGGVSVWVERPGLASGEGINASHASEISLDKDDFDLVLWNDGSLGDLNDKVDKDVTSWGL
jgi:5'-nucleotidase